MPKDKKQKQSGPTNRPPDQDINYRLAQMNVFMTFSARIIIKLLDKNKDILEDLSDKDHQMISSLRRLNTAVEEFDKKHDEEAKRLMKKAKEEAKNSKKIKNKKKKDKKSLRFPGKK